jgi:hypothetical protein
MKRLNGLVLLAPRRWRERARGSTSTARPLRRMRMARSASTWPAGKNASSGPPISSQASALTISELDEQ